MVDAIGTTVKMLGAAAVIGLLTATGAVAQQYNPQQSPYDQGGIGLSPGKSNCGSQVGCADYPSGEKTKTNPARNSSRGSRTAQENRITAELNREQLSRANNQQATTPAPAPTAP